MPCKIHMLWIQGCVLDQYFHFWTDVQFRTPCQCRQRLTSKKKQKFIHFWGFQWRPHRTHEGFKFIFENFFPSCRTNFKITPYFIQFNSTDFLQIRLKSFFRLFLNFLSSVFPIRRFRHLHGSVKILGANFPAKKKGK